MSLKVSPEFAEMLDKVIAENSPAQKRKAISNNPAQKRKAISKKHRFEVLKRDSFTCQYCGKQPPETILEIDHIKPVAKGGDNSLLNLVTACVDCNRGKSARELSDNTTVKKQQKQLQLLNEKQNQIAMMIEWKESLIDHEADLVNSAEAIINLHLTGDTKVSEIGKTLIHRAIKKHGYTEVVDAIEQDFKDSANFEETWAKCLKFLGKEKPENSPHYIKGILRNRFNGFNERKFYTLIKGVDLSTDEAYLRFVEEAKTIKNITEYFKLLEDSQ